MPYKFLSVCLILMIVAFAVQSEESAISKESLNHIWLEGYVTQDNQYVLDIEFTLTDKIISSVLLYSEPGHSLLCGLVNPEITSPESLEKIKLQKPRTLAIGSTTTSKSRVVDSVPVLTSDQISVECHVISEKGNAITEIANITLNSYENFGFGLGFAPDGTGCFTWGKCGNGPEFQGPYCDPCISTLCCYGDSGYIVCGHVLCE